MKLYLKTKEETDEHFASDPQLIMGILREGKPSEVPAKIGFNPLVVHHFVYRFENPSQEDYANFSENDKQTARAIVHNFLEFKEGIEGLVVYESPIIHDSPAIVAALDSIFKLDLHLKVRESLSFNEGLYRLVYRTAVLYGF
ncbi:hypothetical protein KA107_00030 [Candidatus Pacearchaeota archaeon]|nr:hypothetical protein [Candidatus Pacearchaeota archaeon]